MSDPSSKKIPSYIQFVFGGMAGMGGTCVVHPMDVVKTRMQVSGAGSGTKEYTGALDCIQKMVRSEGPTSLYKGIGAGLLRQATYTTARLGVYTLLIEKYKNHYSSNPTVAASMTMAVAAGACGAFVGTPAEVALIRMQTDGRLPPAERRNYGNVANALFRIVKEEGILKLWRGCVPTVGRAMVVNMAQLASYSQLKAYFKRQCSLNEGLGLHFVASMCSGVITTITSMPIDIAKTRIQNQKVVDGKREYKGTIEVLVKVARHEGILSLWKGITPYFLRLGPHTVLAFVFLEHLNSLYGKHVLGEDRTSGI